eukprot:1314843-Amorphochlora_amoeboformis.AAC.2
MGDSSEFTPSRGGCDLIGITCHVSLEVFWANYRVCRLSQAIPMGCDVRVWRVGTMGIGWIIGSCNRGWGATLMRLKLFGIVLIVLASSTHVASASRSLPAGGQRFQRFQRSENHARARQGSVDTSVDVSVDPNDHTCDDFVHSDDHDHRHYCHHRFLSHHQHIDQDIHKDTSQDTSRDNKPHTSQDTSEDTSQNTSQDTNQDTSHDTSQDKSQAHRDETDESEHPQYPNRAVVVFRNLVDEVVNIMYWNEAQKHEVTFTPISHLITSLLRPTHSLDASIA